jgi:hypothetical protein
MVRWRNDVGRRRGGTGRGKGGENVSWADVNLTGPKNKENSYGQLVHMDDEDLKQR